MSKDTKHFFNQKHQTGWNASREQSRWHFDTTIDESRPANDLLRKNFVKFKGDWQPEIDNAVFDREPPMDLTEFLTVGSVQESLELNVDYKSNLSTRSIVKADSGHPKLWKIIKELGIEDPFAMIYKQKPGQINWLHLDRVCCHDTIDRSGIDSYELEQDNDLVRVLVALEDWQWGHFAQMGNHLWHQWSAGDIVWFDWQNLPHCTANAGHLDRHFLKITGRTSNRFKELLKQQDKIIKIG
jgi:hypothetical protein